MAEMEILALERARWATDLDHQVGSKPYAIGTGKVSPARRKTPSHMLRAKEHWSTRGQRFRRWSCITDTPHEIANRDAASGQPSSIYDEAQAMLHQQEKWAECAFSIKVLLLHRQEIVVGWLEHTSVSLLTCVETQPPRASFLCNNI
jgi:hypothetical protein